MGIFDIFKSSKAKELIRTSKYKELDELLGEDKANKEIVYKLHYLMEKDDAMGSGSDREAVKEIKKIGKYLCSNGGEHRMLKVADQFLVLHKRIRSLELYWDGMCGWMY